MEQELLKIKNLVLFVLIFTTLGTATFQFLLHTKKILSLCRIALVLAVSKGLSLLLMIQFISFGLVLEYYVISSFCIGLIVPFIIIGFDYLITTTKMDV